ncbi:hypothetical protein ACFQ6N_06735 [Kitasatospora sp. NPDC056446]|uniref:hypothetical protein n=1 Tax=Kitasatospora sp. NPDC056446 TaxID=3345819 RepID=UPI00368246CF
MLVNWVGVILGWPVRGWGGRVGRVRMVVRVGVGVLAAALLGGAVWLAWVVTAQRMGAAMGLGPADGVVVVERCYEVSDGEGNSDGTDCQGRFTPAGAGGDQARPIVVRGATGKHRAGTRLPVRLAQGVAHEPSSSPAVKYGVVAGMILVAGAVPAGWLLTAAWRGRALEGTVLFGAVFAGLTAVAVLGIAVGLFAGIVEVFL